MRLVIARTEAKVNDQDGMPRSSCPCAGLRRPGQGSKASHSPLFTPSHSQHHRSLLQILDSYSILHPGFESSASFVEFPLRALTTALLFYSGHSTAHMVPPASTTGPDRGQ